MSIKRSWDMYDPKCWLQKGKLASCLFPRVFIIVGRIFSSMPQLWEVKMQIMHNKRTNLAFKGKNHTLEVDISNYLYL